MDGRGSVRAARERLAQAQAIQRTQQQEQRENRMTQIENLEPLMVPRLQQDVDRSPVRTAVLLPPSFVTDSRYTQQSPQWPLPIAKSSIPMTLGSSVYAPVPPVNEPSGLNQITPSLNSNSSQAISSIRSNDLISLSKSDKSHSLSSTLGSYRNPKTLSQTTLSSLGTIPDFPVASNYPSPSPEQNSRSQMTGLKVPPPNYQQFSVVSPIAEERGSRMSVKSYASSHAMPSVRTDFYFDDTPSDEEPSPRATHQPHQPLATLIRQASIGKRIGRPSVTSIKARSKPLPIPGDMDRNTHDSSTLQLSSAKYEPMKAANYSKDLDMFVGDLEKGSDSDESLRRVPRSQLSERVGTRRPPNLDFERTRAAESRGSLTSLPELIKRATRLRTNLDHGRTASRLGGFTNGWGLSNPDVVISEKKEAGRDVRSPIHSDAGTDWPSGRSANQGFTNRRSRFNFVERLNPSRSKRTLITLVVLLIVLITAAIVIPVVLIVVPKQHASASTSPNLSCSKSLVCTNGGIPLQLPDGSCDCACVEGFQGFKCKRATDPACSNVTLEGGEQISLGKDVTPLLKSAASFGVTLNPNLLANTFENSNMSCTSENALVALPNTARSTTSNNASLKNQGVTTINGIVVAGTPSPSVGGSASVSASSLPAITPLPISNGPGTNSSAQEFAKVGILFVLQDSRELATASRAQENLLSFMESISTDGTARSAAMDVPLGNGYSINLWDFRIKARNGTTYGVKQ